jgi:hypothetical protein
MRQMMAATGRYGSTSTVFACPNHVGLASDSVAKSDRPQFDATNESPPIGSYGFDFDQLELRVK